MSVCGKALRGTALHGTIGAETNSARSGPNLMCLRYFFLLFIGYFYVIRNLVCVRILSGTYSRLAEASFIVRMLYKDILY